MKTNLFWIMMVLILFPSCSNKKHVHNEDFYYTCSMDPQVVESKPGNCPICKMPLTPVKKSTNQAKDQLELSDQQIQLGNIQFDTIRMGSVGDKVVLTAILSIDQMKTNAISSRLMGRIDKLYFKNTGDYVRKGDKVFDLYSEELNAAKQEYLLALEKKKTLDNGIIDFSELVKAARTKLLLWGMTEGQISALEETNKATPYTSYYSPVSGYITSIDAVEGQYVMEGGPVFRLADLSTLWVEGQVYASQLSQVSQTSIAEVEFPDLPGRKVNGRIEFVNPEVNTDSRVTLIRVTVPNPGNMLKPGMSAYFTLKGMQRNTLTLPTQAVIQDAKGATVWIKTGPNAFKSRMVDVGLETNGVIEVRGGLKEGDVVVISGAYLLNSEFIFKKGTDPMAGHKM